MTSKEFACFSCLWVIINFVCSIGTEVSWGFFLLIATLSTYIAAVINFVWFAPEKAPK